MLTWFASGVGSQRAREIADEAETDRRRHSDLYIMYKYRSPLAISRVSNTNVKIIDI
jgi:hypothetical protein